MDFEIGGARNGAKGEVTRARIKQCARELFARHGLERVTIRDIAKYAGQRNGGSINYYFRSKEDLIAEILIDAAREADEARERLLDKMLASGETPTVRSILKLMVSSEEYSDNEPIRLISMLMNERRDMMHRTVPGKLDHGYRRCVEMLQPLLPEMPYAIFTQRMFLTISYLWTNLAKREGGDERAEFWQKFWNNPISTENLFDTAVGMLCQPVSAETQTALDG